MISFNKKEDCIIVTRKGNSYKFCTVGEIHKELTPTVNPKWAGD